MNIRVLNLKKAAGRTLWCRGAFLFAFILLSAANLRAQSCAPAPSGLVAWWPGESNTLDVLGINNGTLQGAAVYGPGEVGTAFSFDGTNGTMFVPDSPSLRITNQLTLEAWINTQRTNSSSPDQSIIGKLGGAAGNNGYQIALSGNTLLGLFNSPGQGWPGYILRAPLPITPGTWNHVALTYDQSSMKLYFNGQPVATNVIGPAVINPSSANLHVSSEDTYSAFFAGLIDEPSVYNRALSASEIAAIYTAGSAGKCPTSSPPVIVSQPANESIPVGSTAAFSVGAQGAAPLSYQWSFNGTNLAAATGTILVLTNVQTIQAGSYAVEVSNADGSTTSSNAILTLNTLTCDPPASGLVSWWQAESNAFDALGFNNGTLQGVAGYAPGEVGLAFSFDQNSGTLFVPDSPRLRLTNQLTLEAWINTQRTNSTSPDQSIISKVGGATGNNGYQIALSQGNLLVGIFNSPGQSWPGYIVMAPLPITPGTWNHVAFTYDQSSMKLYFNGQPVATNVVGPVTISATSANLHVSSDDAYNAFFDGLIDEAAVYSRALSASEIAAIYNAGSAGKCPTSSPPVIVSQPASQTVPIDGTATFSVVADGTAPLSYQWSFDGTNISSATGASLTLTNVQPTQAGNYVVQVTNPYGSANTSNTVLTVTVPICDPPAPGLVSWWQAESNSLDALGLNNGTLQGLAGYGAGDVGTAFSFDSSSGTMIVPDSPSLRLTSQMTLEAWINTERTNSSSPDQEIIGKVGGAAGNNGYALTLSGNALVAMFNSPGQGWPQYEVAAPLPLVTGTWNHIAFTYDQSAMKLYFNGQPVATNLVGPAVINTSIANLHVSGDDNNHAYFAGLIDEPSVYNRALSANEIAAIYNAGSAGKCPTSSPPIIVSQPVNQAVPPGATATFNVLAEGGAPLGYQWSFDGTNVAGATSASLVLTNVQQTEGGTYAVQVSNAGGSITSSNALLTVIVTSCAPAPSGLVSWWEAQSNALDALGLNNGTLEGAAGYGAGEMGTAFSFNPASGTMIVPDSPSLRLTSQMTLEAWINTQRTNSSSPDQEIIGKVGGAAGNNGYAITLSGNSLVAMFNSPGQGWPQYEVAATLPLVTGTWNHVAFTYDQSAMKLYFNGQPVATNVIGPAVINTSSANLHVSGDDNNHAYFAGLIDEPSVYNRALSASEIASIYNAGSAGKCPPSIPPSIVTQPRNQSLPSGATATFSVAAEGTTPLSYQWSYDGTNLAGATGTSLILTNVQTSQAGYYSVEVTNLYGAVVSSNASLTVFVATCVPPPAGLVSWWAGESNALDTLGTNNGTLAGAAGYGPGEVGTAFSFNPASGTVVVPDSPSLRVTNQMTLEAWINTQRTNSSSPDQEIIGKLGGAAGNNGYALILSGNSLVAQFNSPGQGWPQYELAAPLPLVAGTWYHVAFTYDHSAMKLYFNGQPVATNVIGPAVINATVANLHVSGDDNNHAYFAGLIDEPSIYNRALSVSEIASIYNAGSAGKCPPSIPPLIVTQPMNQTLPSGATAIFSVAAESIAPLSYQWSYDGTNLAGATGTSLILTNVQPSQAGNYSVQVANLYGSATSSNASLTVIVPICVPPPSGLVAWWTAESNALDTFGINNGTLEGGAGYGPGEVGTAFSFDGTSGTMIVPDSPSLRVTNQMTLEAWINTQRTNGSSPDQEIIGKVGGAAGNNGYALTLSGNALVAMFNSPGQGWPQYEVAAPLPLVTGTWNHIAFTYDQSAMKLYFNGQPVATNVIGPAVINATIAHLHVSGDDNNHAYFDGLIDEPSVYNRALAASEIAAIYNAGSAGKCPAPIPPFIASQPFGQSVTVGGSASFAVLAGGAAPLSYQWTYNGVTLAGAASSSLTLTNVQMGQAGNYAVQVTNLYGLANSSNATLTVNPAPSVIQAVSLNATSGIVVVPIILISQGTENALQFSVDFNPSLLTFTGATLGNDVTNGSLLTNLNQIGTGKLGLLISLPPDASFTAGTQQLAQISFFATPVSSTNVSAISFGDQPTLRQVSSSLPSILPASYVGGNVSVPPLGVEADVFPIPNGDGTVSAIDVVQMGRFVAGLDVITNASEFQKADCAPRATLGDGLLTVADWVQAGRYAAALDSLVAAGGPTQPQGGGGPNAIKGGLRIQTDRMLFLPPATIQAGQPFQIPVQLASQGDENGLEFSLAFDPSVLGYLNTAVGSGASGASMRVNTNSIGSGRLGIVMTLPTGSTFGGATQQVATVSFAVAATARGSSSISFATQPLPQQVVSVTAAELPTSYVSDLIAITPIVSPTLNVATTTSNLVLSWPVSATGFVLESSSSVSSPNWSAVSATPVTNATQIVVTVSPSGAQKFYRLRHP